MALDPFLLEILACPDCKAAPGAPCRDARSVRHGNRGRRVHRTVSKDHVIAAVAIRYH